MNENLNITEQTEIEKLKKLINNTEEWNAEEINNQLYDMLVPDNGKADTKAGEILRAVNRIAYRFWNDGDLAGQGYGNETVNPAVRYLYNNVTNASKFKSVVIELYKQINYPNLSDNEYEELLNELVRENVIYILNKEIYNIPNIEDMWDYKDPEKDVDDTYEDEEEYFEDDWNSVED